MFASLDILKSLKKKLATVIIKHANPCGVSENKNPLNHLKMLMHVILKCIWWCNCL